MNMTDTINATLSINDQQHPKKTQKYGNTTFEVYVHFSETSTETLTDKVMRLIRNDIIAKNIS